MSVFFALFLKMFAAAVLLPLAALGALISDGAVRGLAARILGEPSPSPLQPVHDVLKLSFKESIEPRGSAGPLFRAAPWLSLALVLTVFLYIPAGRFPAVLGGEGDVILIFFLLVASSSFRVLGGTASANSLAVLGAGRETALMMAWGVPFSLVVGALAWLAWRTGMPGVPMGIEVFVAKSVWSVVGGAGVLGLTALMFALAAILPAVSGEGPMQISESEDILSGLSVEYSGIDLAFLEIAGSLRAFAVSALFVSFFLPISASGPFGRGGFFVATLEFPLFWTKVFLVRTTIGSASRVLFTRLSPGGAVRFCLGGALGLSLVGALLLSVDLLL